MPEPIQIVIEIPRGGCLKRRADGGVDFISPLPCPYNYGSVPDSRAEDGDPVDALVLGPRLARGTRVSQPLRAVVRFIDAGAQDRKLVCSALPLTEAERTRIDRFFRLYACFKQVLNAVRGRRGATRYEGLEDATLDPG